jgi:predicted RNA-binding Zn ribbon-like protein
MGDTPQDVNLLGGALCLDFANSVDWANGEPIKDEVLKAPGDVVAWGRRLGLGRVANGGDQELAQVHELRRAMHATFAAIALERRPPPAALARLEEVHAQAVAAARMTRAGDGAWRPTWPASDPRKVRFAAVADAIGLLGHPERLARVRHCPGHGCGWLFIDTSGRRRWCSMDTCGSRAKMRRLYQRRRAATVG